MASYKSSPDNLSLCICSQKYLKLSVKLDYVWVSSPILLSRA